jgi:surfactin synthase thioesterase subunit
MNKKQMNRKKEKEKNKRPLFFFFFSFGCIIDYRFIILASIVTLESLISSVLTFYRLGHSSPGTTDSARISHGSKRVEKILVRERE